MTCIGTGTYLKDAGLAKVKAFLSWPSGIAALHVLHNSLHLHSFSGLHNPIKSLTWLIPHAISWWNCNYIEVKGHAMYLFASMICILDYNLTFDKFWHWLVWDSCDIKTSYTKIWNKTILHYLTALIQNRKQQLFILWSSRVTLIRVAPEFCNISKQFCFSWKWNFTLEGHTVVAPFWHDWTKKAIFYHNIYLTHRH